MTEAKEQSERPRLFTPLAIVTDLVLTAAVFLFFFVVLQPFVPAESPEFVLFFSAYTAACLSGVFWLAASMFRAVLTDERARKKVS